MRVNSKDRTTMKIRTPQEMLDDQLIVKHYAGSLAYGTNTIHSDTDIRGIFAADEIYNTSPWLDCGEIEIPKAIEEDTKYYELVKYMVLCVDQNPNIIETLWVDPSNVIESSPAYEYLVSKRSELLSTKSAIKFGGYAKSQLKRMRNHDKWINNVQPEEPPRQIDYVSLVFDFSHKKILKLTPDMIEKDRNDHGFVSYGNNIFGVYAIPGAQLFNDTYALNVGFQKDCLHESQLPLRIVKFNIEQYRNDLDNHKNYWKWKENRNGVRGVLEDNFGYDTKHAMHLIRLLRMGVEILTDHCVNVYRHDADDLLKIRNGEYSYDEIIEISTKLDRKLKEGIKTTTLQKNVDTELATKILLETQHISW